MTSSSRKQASGAKTVSIDLLALTATLLWVGAIMLVSIFSDDAPLLTWIKWGVIGAICIYAGAFVCLHTYSTRILAGKSEALPEEEKTEEKPPSEAEAETDRRGEQDSEHKEMIEEDGT